MVNFERGLRARLQLVAQQIAARPSLEVPAYPKRQKKKKYPGEATENH
jgi:hypothetical protein